jgi:hypothetical protein
MTIYELLAKLAQIGLGGHPSDEDALVMEGQCSERHVALFWRQHHALDVG